MSDHAYDISYLLDAEPVQAVAPTLRIARAVPPAPALATTGVVEAQEALAKELLQSANIHEALIQQYLRMSGERLQDPFGQ